jgi:hypothetical protein
MFFLSDFRWFWALSVCVSKVLVRGSSLPDFVPVLLIFFLGVGHLVRFFAATAGHHFSFP